jgi:predicted acetyltransferase
MNFTLIQASKEHKIIIENLMQFYIYDFSEFVPNDVEDNGLFAPYPHLENYWEEKNDKFPYIIIKNDKYAGFVLVRRIQSEKGSYFSIAEFFILKKYRLGGTGKSVAFQIFDLHRGHWEVFQRNTNKPAQIFWKKVIKEYSKGQFRERSEDGKQIQTFEN